MIPKIENINIGDEIEIVEEPTYTWKIEGNRIVGYTDGLEAMKQAIYLILNVERYKHEIYDWDYGVELANLFGKDKAYVYSELKRRIKEALMTDNRITDVTNFEFENPDRDTIHVKFTVHTVFGDIEASREVSV
ncbi:DUF2634 domain-containing protein [Clostridium sp. Cult1]|uniref:DUF2634 domain-containing protein n=1 Tax=Clostridium sp. Cult1 TaxID=2079002 RepID=UPI001F24592F|nr:DUF2634 domain-containing protein [Clostridium sp. Cult1]MCF6464212.1 hypothetical protein [Clostridium sp. Cult1]